MQVLDLHQVWDREQDKNRVLVSPESAWLTIEWDIPYPAPIVWEYLTVFRLEKEFGGYDLVERTDSLGGRMQLGTDYHCVHSEIEFYNKILDWKPFDYYTLHVRFEGLAEYIQSRVLTPTESGTRLSFYIAEPPENATEEFRDMLRTYIEEMAIKFKGLIESDIASGKITLP